MPWAEYLNTNLYKVIQTVALLAAAALVRALLLRAVLPHLVRIEVRRRWIISIRNGIVLLVFVGLAGIWADTLREVAVSILAIGVAFVIATREIIQSMIASALKAVTNPFSVGDRIQIGSFRGDVVDQTPLTTTMLEVGPGEFHLRTGRKITFPNNKLMDSFIVNESHTGRYVLHVFTVPLEIGQDWKRAEQLLLAAAEAECSPYLEQVREYMAHLEQAHGLEGLPVQPRISIHLPEAGKLNLLVRVPAAVGRQGRVEQAILRRFLEEFHPGDGETATAE